VQKRANSWYVTSVFSNGVGIDRMLQYEAVSESLKNVVLVMNAASILVPPPGTEDDRDEQQRTLWTATQARLERFLPGFLAEVVPAPQPVPAAEPKLTVSA
jgi:brefeldin A-resistance guanine nucleotide exchange factor 1